MRNLKIEVEYDGANYCGWQIQTGHKKKRSIQQVIEVSLRKLLGEKVKSIVSGRTDAGTNALNQVANFRTKSIMPLHRMRYALNCLLPDDIAVRSIKVVPRDFHSRFDAKSKVYRYSILNRPSHSPLLRNKVYHYCRPLNVELMRKESKVLLGRHNFSAFRASENRERNPVKNIKSLKITKNKDGLVNIDIEADGFLYNMVRNIAGTLLEIGRGRFAEGSLKNILLSRNRGQAGPTLPARGLTLLKVKY